MSTIISIQKFLPTQKVEWNEWIRQSKNGTFLFFREYMEYHASRFQDHSLLFRDADGVLLGVLPASQHADELVSHGGLTFGGLVVGKKTKGNFSLDALSELIRYCNNAGIRKIRYKPVPHIYHDIPAEEDLYALFRLGAKLVRRDLASSIRMDSRLPYSKGRKYGLKLAEKAGLYIARDYNFHEFFDLEMKVLARHNTKPVHTAEEMEALARSFPDNIRLFSARADGELLAGVLMYETPFVAHAQYIGSSNNGKNLGALDAIVDSILSSCTNKRWFDFGISTEQQGYFLNSGLLAQKEMFGARSITYDQYDIDVNFALNLESSQIS